MSSLRIGSYVAVSNLALGIDVSVCCLTALTCLAASLRPSGSLFCSAAMNCSAWYGLRPAGTRGRIASACFSLTFWMTAAARDEKGRYW